MHTAKIHQPIAGGHQAMTSGSWMSFKSRRVGFIYRKRCSGSSVVLH